MQIPSQVGILIRQLREERKFTQRQLSLYSGVSNTEISRLESGERRNPSVVILKKLALAFNTSVDEMLKAAGYTDDSIDKTNAISNSSIFTPENYDGHLKIVKERYAALENMIDSFFNDKQITIGDKERLFKYVCDAFWEAKGMQKHKSKKENKIKYNQ